MDCPRCEAKPALTEVQLEENIVVDACRGCKGIFFEADELGGFLQLSKDLPNYKQLAAEAKASFPCPGCAATMKEIHYVAGSDLEVDFCEGCQGIWLDGGEIGTAKQMADAQDIPKLRLYRSMYDLRRQVRGVARKCPKCSGKVEAIQLDERVTLDMCGGCHGIWFDHGEIKEYLELSEDIPDKKTALASARPTGMKCGMCAGHDELVEIEYSPLEMESGRLHVDYCPGCEGIWIDKDEFVMLEVVAAHSEHPGHRLGRAVKKMEEAGYVIL